MTDYIGKPANRVDGAAKVTGAAKYAAEFTAPDLVYGVVVSSAIAKGKITRLDTSTALALEGVLQIFTHENRPNLAWFDKNYQDEDAPPGAPFRPLYDEKILFSMQPIALVVAETLEIARYAASLVQVEYETETPTTNLEANRAQAYIPKKYKAAEPSPRGNAKEAIVQAPVKTDATYFHTSEHHNPMEMHASTVIYQPDGTLLIYDKTQGTQNSQKYISKIFNLSPAEAHVVSPYVGGAFGSGLRPQYQLFLTVLAAQELKRSVRVMLTRQQMFSFGHRPATLQQVQLGAAPDGALQAIIHENFSETSQFEDYTENQVNWSAMLYNCSDVHLEHKLVALDVYTPLDMRAPGGVTGMYALESAMDELAYELKMDPLELRLKNYTDIDLSKDNPFSSKELRACYQQGAERFGWSKRNPTPRSMREGKNLVGWGLATGAWEVKQQQASAKAILSIGGKLTVSSATSDIGTGTYTIMTQIAADTLGLPLENVTFLLGDSSLPEAPLQGGSWTAASVGTAVQMVCAQIGEKLFSQARSIPNSPFAKAKFTDIIFANGQMQLKTDPMQALSILEIMRQSGLSSVAGEATAKPEAKQKKYSMFTHSAVFAEVKVDEDFGTVHVTRVISAIAGGRVLNPKTARSQIIGGIVWGIGMALEEESMLDHQFGRFMNHDLAEYHVPVNADIHDLDVIFVEEHDDIVNPIGVKGMGEIGIVGTAAAIANAIYHATGKRVRELPITLDKLL
ncbi:xanthine dehydrogenase family protein molybdopterin-binding subunit [Adhaeribacter swui]|uniref:Xanthine dehydrogenase family protein molybdopterin-binding subunit n=2 Tax=Adhaeribacter swui TaxID=2086471 RepID=A0A7G7GFJ7_9BACT|nr:xanthine dehydrogenase family protein molybdopterin-binding subunit [Adhaeribacter swui]QNF35931.1 xanthine dehydrogenase family protein molybdopterin-binding subunit [Adhaeribacter swui]